MNRFGLRKFLLLACCAAALYGCQTPSAVYELAEKSSANAGAFQQQLGEMAAQSKALAAKRADHVAAMDAFNAEFDSYLKRELYMREKSLAPAEWAKVQALMKELVALRDQLIAIEATAQFAQQERRQAVLGLRTDLNTFQAAMRDATNALNTLAKHQSDSERAAFFGKFLGDVHKEVKNVLESNDATAQKAKAALDKLKNEFQQDDSN
jgi:hypothetical protein